MKTLNRRRSGALALVVAVFGVATVQAALYDFNDGTEFDNVGLGASMTVDGITMTTVEIIGLDGTSATNGVNNKTNIQGDVNSLGINSANFSNTDIGSESRDFNPVEAWVFEFDSDVTLEEIDLSSMGEGTFMTMSANGVLLFTFDDSMSGDIFDLGSTFIAGGTDIMIQNTSELTATDTTARISSLTVIPEPATLGLMSACAVGAFIIRRFRV